MNKLEATDRFKQALMTHGGKIMDDNDRALIDDEEYELLDEDDRSEVEMEEEEEQFHD